MPPRANTWTCDNCGGPLIGAVWFPHDESQWCEDCFTDYLAATEDHREYTSRLLRELEFEREEKAHA